MLMAQLRIIFYIHASVIISFNAVSYAFVLYFSRWWEMDDEKNSINSLIPRLIEHFSPS